MNQIEYLKEYIKCITGDRYEPYELQDEYVEGEYEYKKEEEPEWLKENNINNLEEFQAFADYAVYQDFWDFFEEDMANLELENIEVDTKERTLGIKIISYSEKYHFAHFKIKGLNGDWIELSIEHGDSFYYNPKTNKINFEEEGSYFESKGGSYGILFGVLELALNWRAKKRLRKILSILTNLDLTISNLINETEKIVVCTQNGHELEFDKKKSSFIARSPDEFPELRKYMDKALMVAMEL